MTAVVVGAASGIGTAIAREFETLGHDLVITARNEDQLKALEDSLNRVKLAVALDIEDLNQVEKAAEAILANLDEDPYVVIAIGSMFEFEKAHRDADAALRLMDINFRNVVAFLTPIANELEKRGQGCIVLISSVAGERGRQSNYVYGAAKAGLTVYAQGLRNRLAGRGVHVLTVIPGYVDTKMLRAAMGDDYASAPKQLISSPETAAQKIVQAAIQRKNVIYVSGVWRWIMAIIRMIPESVFKRLNL